MRMNNNININNQEYIPLCNTSKIKTGKLDSNAAEINGIYPFFTCAPKPLKINTYEFDDDVIILAGNNAAGNFHCQRFHGKFNAYQRTYIITTNEDFNIDYIYYNLINDLYKFKKLAKGSETKFLTIDIINNFKIKNLSIKEQEKIANVLSALDDKIELNNRINKKLEEMARTLYDYWFLQFDFPDEHGRSYKSSGGSMTYSPQLKRQIPTGWKIVTLGDIIEEMPKSNIQVNEADKVGGNIPFIKSGESMGTYNKSLVSGRYIFLNTGGNAGVKFYVGNVAYSTDTWCINAIDNMTDYLYIFLSYIVNQIQRNCFEGTGLQHLQKDIFKQIKIIKPENSVIEKYNKIICPLFNQYYKNKQENRKLEAARDFLLPMLMNGQATVED